MSANPKADYYLRHVAGALAGGFPISLRDNLDPWYAHEFGGVFLTGGERPHTFDYPCPWQHWGRLCHHHFWVTPEANVILEAGRRRDPWVKKPPVLQRTAETERFRLVVDHAVPFRVLKPLLVSALDGLREERWIETVRELLRAMFRRGVLTRAQDLSLNAGVRAEEPLKSAMPSDWDGADPFARYKAMGFEQVTY